MQIAICDDEREMCDILMKKVQELYPEEEVRMYQSGKELLAAKEDADILLLDIQMPQKNGMELARELRRSGKNTIIIFITALEEYVFQAFDVGAFHYLVKPFEDEKFKVVLQRAVQQYQERNTVSEEKEERCLLIKTGGVCTKVMVSDIIYAEVFNRKVMIHKTDGDIEYYGKMFELETQLGGDFFRTHRAYLVHYKYVVRYDASTVYLKRGRALIAKNNYAKFVKGYLKYNIRKGSDS